MMQTVGCEKIGSIGCEKIGSIGYDNMLQRFSFEKLSNYLKNNQGQTLNDISITFNEDIELTGYLINIWIYHWNTFFKMGRIVKKNDKFYYLYPTNKHVKDVDPIINNII
tara:strand:+ start:217 stop:546 length:330 start_codon:yes stop_codon:yes gene_type:complete